MRNPNKPLILFCITIFISSCSILKKQNAENALIEYKPESTNQSIDSINDYRTSETRKNDIIHTKLEVSFGWANQFLYGKATIKVKPYFYPTSTLLLDARGMKITKVVLVDTAKSNMPLQYSEQENILNIQLDRAYKRTEEYTVYIEYTSMPEQLKEKGGSSAITDDKGLYFINPQGEDLHKPKQIWTQGETQSNSVWFPTIDRPNERMTHEIYITVDTQYTTLSNGELIYQITNADGTRTDYWKMDLPHAPYLVMMAVGEFDIVKDKWREKDVNYYIEKEYAPFARDIFGTTPEMMEFYSLKLGVDFPWNKYSQIIVRDFVSGAMENTTAAVFGEFMMRNRRELLDKNYEYIVAHELFHEWFGDMVTCESWSNIPLNESFATYGEYLWKEYKYGRYAADYHSEHSRKGYLSEAQTKRVPLIRYYYNDREDMFDAHSYNKGGQILHMLRKYVGDEAFFASLKLYLETNKYSSVEAADLRLAFEQVTGEDLNWFFNQWFFSHGHPHLVITTSFDTLSGQLRLSISQTQVENNIPLFKIPMAIDIYVDGQKQRHEVILTRPNQTFEFKLSASPDWVNVDAEKMLLCTKSEQKTVQEWAFQYYNGPLYLDRKEAIQGLLDAPEDSLAQEVFYDALSDPFWALRSFAVAQFGKVTGQNKQKFENKLIKMVETDSVSNVRYTALSYLSYFDREKKLMEVYKNALNDSSYTVISYAIASIAKIDSLEALKIAARFENEKNTDILKMIAELYSLYGSESNHAFYMKAIHNFNSYSKPGFLMYYGDFLRAKVSSPEEIDNAIVLLKDTAEQNKSKERIVSMIEKLIKELEVKKQ